MATKAMLSFPTLAFGDLLHNLPFLVRAGHGRLTWTQDGNTSHSIRHCLDLFHRLTDPTSLCLMMVFEDILVRVVGPFVSTVQLHLEPCSVHRCMEQVLRTISRFERAISRTRILFRVISLCRQWVDEPTLERFIKGYAYTPSGMLLPTLLQHAVTLLAQGRPIVNKVQIQAAGAADPKLVMCLGAHCVCNAVQQHGGISKEIKVKWLQAVGFLSSWLQVARLRSGAQRCFVTTSMFLLMVCFAASAAAGMHSTTCLCVEITGSDYHN